MYWSVFIVMFVGVLCVQVCVLLYEFGFVVIISFTGVSVMDVFVLLLLLLLLWPLRITGDVYDASEIDMCWGEGVRLDSDILSS